MREVNRRAKVGEYIKLIDTQYTFDEVGDILKIDCTNGTLPCVLGKNHKRKTGDNNEKWSYPDYVYVVLEDYKEENMRNLKERKEFTKDDLKYGDKLTLRNGEVGLYKEKYTWIDFLNYDNINNDLTNNGCRGKELDIVKVERSTYTTVYERNEEEKEMTVAEISEALGYEVKVVK